VTRAYMPERAILPSASSVKGHQERFAPPSLMDRCGFIEGTFAETDDNGRDARKQSFTPRVLNGAITCLR
jgi:hypothetical protein